MSLADQFNGVGRPKGKKDFVLFLREFFEEVITVVKGDWDWVREHVRRG